MEFTRRLLALVARPFGWFTPFVLYGAAFCLIAFVARDNPDRVRYHALNLLATPAAIGWALRLVDVEVQEEKARQNADLVPLNTANLEWMRFGFFSLSLGVMGCYSVVRVLNWVQVWLLGPDYAIL